MNTSPLTPQRSTGKHSSPLSMQPILSHATIKATPNEQACYVMLEISPSKDLPTSRLPLNLCLVLDKSTSMQGIRLQQVKEATRQIIDFLEPEDTLSLVVFSDKAEVLLPGQKNVDKALAKSVASTIQPSGGTEMLQGLLAGLQEIQTNRSEMSVNHIILLTDGRTYGDDEECIKQAEWAGLNQISLSTMGIGADWNEDLLEKMADVSGGTSTYIDTPRRIVESFKATVRELSTIVAREVSLVIELADNVTLHEAFQIAPHIRRLDINDDHKLALGPLGTNNRKIITLELRISNAEPGKQQLMRLNVMGDVPTQALNRQADNWTDITVNVSSDTDAEVVIPPVIITALGKLAIYKMQEKAMQDMASGNIIAATQRLETMATRLLNLGETELARAALLEAGRLARTGSLSSEGRKKIRYGTRSLSILPQEL